jgi:hypothetical protein
MVAIPGPDPDRVLLVGSGPAAGVGVVTHGSALTGALARQLADHSGRGAVVESIGRIQLRLKDIPGLLASTRLERYDAIVVTGGMMEAIELTSNKRWARSLLAVLDSVHENTARDSAVVFAGMPAPTSTGGAGKWRGRLIDRRAAALNRTSSKTATLRTHGHFVQLGPSDHVGGQPTAACYSDWASQICAVLEPALSDDDLRPHTRRIS